VRLRLSSRQEKENAKKEEKKTPLKQWTLNT
jgi:hypothetical protein